MRKNGNTNNIDHDINIYNVLFLLHKAFENGNDHLGQRCLKFIESIDNIPCWLFVLFQANHFDMDGSGQNKEILLKSVFKLGSRIPHEVARMLEECKEDVFTHDVLTVLDHTIWKQRLIDLKVRKFNIYISVNVFVCCTYVPLLFVNHFVWVCVFRCLLVSFVYLFFCFAFL